MAEKIEDVKNITNIKNNKNSKNITIRRKVSINRNVLNVLDLTGVETYE